MMIVKEWLGSLLVIGSWLLALALAQDVSAAVDNTALATIAGSIVQAITITGGLGGAGWFIARRIDKMWDARETARRDEKEHDRKREDARDNFFIEQLKLCHQEKTEERTRNETLVSELMERISCAPTFPPKPQ